MHALVILMALTSMIFFVAAVVFWVWTLIDCVTNKRLTDGQKIAWALAIFFVGLIGSLIYFFVGRAPKVFVAAQPYYYPSQAQGQPQVPDNYRPYQEGYRVQEHLQPSLASETISANEEQPAQQAQYEHIQISYPE